MSPSCLVIPEELSLAVASRRMSVAPVNRAAAAAAAAASNLRNMSGRHSSMFYGRSAMTEGTPPPRPWLTRSTHSRCQPTMSLGHEDLPFILGFQFTLFCFDLFGFVVEGVISAM